MWRRRSTEFTSTREIASGAEWAGPEAPGLRSLALAEAWRRAVGPAVGAVTRLSRCGKRCLEIDVLDGAWLGNLESLEPQIVERLNKELGASKDGEPGRAAVASLRFRAVSDQGGAPAVEAPSRQGGGQAPHRRRPPGAARRPRARGGGRPSS